MVNISTERIIEQKVEKENDLKNSQKKKIKFNNFEFDEKHYLNTRLSKGENKKEIVIRLLPFSKTELSPFKKVYIHSVKITNENGEKQWKKFMCPIKMEKGDKCPFCETAEKAKKLKFETKDEALKKKYNGVEFMNMVKTYWLVRCIDREHEDHGVKFWRFPDTKNGEGIWDKIYSLFETKKRRGVEIFDLYNGKDLVITVNRQVDSSGKEKMVYQIQDDENIKPLSESEEQMKKWVDDPMTWEDVYSVKDYDYLSLILLGEWPVWSKDLNKWIAKSESEKIEKEAKEMEIQENLKPMSNDFSSFTVDIKDEKTDNNTKIDESNNEQNYEGDDDDLPF